VGVLALLGGAAIVLGNHLRARQHLQLAQQALERDDLDLAQEHLERCLQIGDNRAEVYHLATQTARRREDFDRADAHLTAWENLAADRESALLERQMLIAQQGEPDRVLKRLKAVMDQRPVVAVAILEALGKGYLNSYVNTDAMTCFTALLQRQPDHVRALLWRGKTHASQERWDKALDDYRRATELAPTLDEARLCLAATFYRLGRSWEALPHYTCLQQRQPDNAEVLLGLARCRYDQHEIEAARQLLDTLLAEHPDDADALLTRGLIDYHTGQPAAAEPWLCRAAAAAPHNRDTQRALLLCLQAQCKDTAAKQCVAQLEQIDTERAAMQILIQKSKAVQRDAPLCWQIGEHLRRLGREKDAVSWYFGALGEDENYAPAHESLAGYFQRRGQLYRARRHVRDKVTK
jgi:tetratricopeptide (TPR) repeat protein